MPPGSSSWVARTSPSGVRGSLRWRRGARDLAARPAARASATGSPWGSTPARPPRCLPTSRWPSARARAGPSARCCGRATIPSAPAARCGGRSRPCARASARSALETPGDSVALLPGDGLEVDVLRFRELAGEDAAGDRLEEAVGALPRRAAGGLRPARQPRVRPLAVDGGRRAAARARRACSRGWSPGWRRRASTRARFALALRWLELDSLHEPAHRALIRLYAWTGDRAAALNQYRDCVRTLSHELGVPPVDETARAVRAGQRGSAGAARSRRARPRGRAALRGAVRAAAGGPRARIWRALGRAHAATAGDGRLAVIEGEAGIGKTRLAAELIAQVRERGGVVLAARCHDDEAGLPYGPVVELLRQALERDGLGGGRVTAAAGRCRRCCMPELAGLRDDLPAPLSLDGAGRTRPPAGGGRGRARRRRHGGFARARLHRRRARRRRGHARRARLPRAQAARRGRCCSPSAGAARACRRVTGCGAWPGTSRATAPRRSCGWSASARRTSPRWFARRGRTATLVLERRVYIESEGLPLFVAEYLAALQAGEPSRARCRARSAACWRRA